VNLFAFLILELLMIFEVRNHDSVHEWSLKYFHFLIHFTCQNLYLLRSPKNPLPKCFSNGGKGLKLILMFGHFLNFLKLKYVIFLDEKHTF